MKKTLHLGGELDIDPEDTYDIAYKKIFSICENCGYWIETVKIENAKAIEVTDRWDEWKFRIVYDKDKLFAVTNMKTKKVHNLGDDGMLRGLEYWFEGKECHRWDIGDYSCGYCGNTHKTMEKAEECYIVDKKAADEKERKFVPKVDDGSAEEVLKELKDYKLWKPIKTTMGMVGNFEILYATKNYYGLTVTFSKDDVKKAMGVGRVTKKIVGQYVKENAETLLIQWLGQFNDVVCKFNKDAGRTDYDWGYNVTFKGDGKDMVGCCGVSVAMGISKIKEEA